MSAKGIANVLNSCNLTNLDLQDKNKIANVFTEYFTSANLDSDTDSESEKDNSIDNEQGMYNNYEVQNIR